MIARQSFDDGLKALLSQGLEAAGFGNYQNLISIEITKDNRFGDFSTNIALRLSTSTKQDPSAIAQSLVDNLKKNLSRFSISSDIEEIKNVGGFINFFLTKSFFYKQLSNILN